MISKIIIQNGQYSCELIAQSIKTHKELFDRFEMITEMIKPDIKRILKSKGVYLRQGWEEAYIVACRTTLFGITEKDHLYSTKKFKRLNVEKALKWIQSRIANNLLSYLTNSAFIDYIPIIVSIDEDNFQDTIEGDDEISKYVAERTIEQLQKDEIISGLKKLYILCEEDFDFFEIKNLCKKYEINFSKIVADIEIPTKVEKNGQIAFDFDLLEEINI